MSNPSNLYAEKVFAEHPTALWALDEKLDYISLISNVERDLSSWTPTLGTTLTNLSNGFPGRPLNTVTTKMTGVVNPLSLFGEVSATSPSVFTLSDLDISKETFSIATYLYADNPYVVNYEIGYIYTTGGDSKKVSKIFSSNINSQWVFISETFIIPKIFDPSATIQLFIKARYSNADILTYDFIVNGITCGQWSEEFSAVSTGIDPASFVDVSPILDPANNNPDDLWGIPATAYGMKELDAYYLAPSNGSKSSLLAKNTSIPMVYGSSSITRLYPDPAQDIPSIIFPGQGFLNKSGKYQDHTFEAWIKISSDSSNNLRQIIGPIFSSNGLYVQGPFLKLIIDESVGSHFVGEWGRPMLISIKLSESSASLVVNGEEVIRLSIDTSQINLASELNDWIGIYAYSDVPTVDIDCVAIYPYVVPTVLSKRRFAFGQAVEYPDKTNKAFGGKSAIIDYRFADYTNNYTYPDLGKWEQGILENITVDKKSLSLPKYSTPEVILKDSTVEKWYKANSYYWAYGGDQWTDQNITFKDSSGYLFFNNFLIFSQPTKAIYGIFKVNQTFTGNEEVLIKIENPTNGSYLQVSVIDDLVYYKLNMYSLLETIHTDMLNKEDKLFIILDIEMLKQSFGGKMSDFFSNVNQLKMYVAGTKDLTNTFTGKIYKVGLCSERNFNKIKDLTRLYFPDLSLPNIYDSGSYNSTFWPIIIDGGTPETQEFFVRELQDHIASYTLVAKYDFNNNLSLDIEANSYWEDYVPLTHFAQYVQDSFGDYSYDLDFIQFNIDYPAPRLQSSGKYDTSDSMIKTYVSFQYLAEGANKRGPTFLYTKSANSNNVLIPDSRWLDTKYEIVDGTVIYPPGKVSSDKLAIMVHVEFDVPGINSNPISIKSLQLASEAFNGSTSNPVGTKHGVSIYPYAKYASYYDYSARNPFRIYKGSTPHLYLTETSGIQKVGESDPLVPRGFMIPINDTQSPSYRVISSQAFMNFTQDSFPALPVRIFEIESSVENIGFFIQANDETGQRGRIFSVDAKTGASFNGLSFYINGNLTREPVVSLNEWFALGISFSKQLVFDDFVGAIRFTGPMLINNISYYEASGLQKVERETKRSWFGVLSSFGQWLDVLRKTNSGNYVWNDILVISSTDYYGISPQTIYQSYVGTRKTIVDDYKTFSIGKCSYSIISDINWRAKSYTAV